LGREHRIAGDEHEAQQVVADGIVDCGVEIRPPVPTDLDLVPELLVLTVEHLAAAQLVDRAMLRGGHEPGSRVVRDTRLGPALERYDERVLCQVLGQADVAGDPSEPGDQPGGLDAPHRVDRVVRVGLGHRLRSFCAIRALTSFRTSVAGSGLSTVKRMVPLEGTYGATAVLSAPVRWVLMKRLQ